MSSETSINRKEKEFNYPMAALLFVAVTILVIVLSLKLNDTSIEFSNQVTIESNIQAPDFSFPGLDDKKVSLGDHKGKIVLVNIWATWCPPCVEEMPSMEKLYQKFKGKNFEILAVSIDETGAKAVAPFMKKTRLTFPALIDAQGTIKTTYKITGIPESFIIDKQGFLIKKIVGPVDWAAPKVFRYFSELIQKPVSQ
ncbi:MAG: TlpA disulfide reductase family protein [Desulfobacterales bacterium]|jgi:peroxiredoxin